ncbi:MAG: radical SAM family heme chaperone HemW [Anaerolineae bacterium]|nr:radical SAM family heme chaperone HemW [Anaerolineae bacterium]
MLLLPGAAHTAAPSYHAPDVPLALYLHIPFCRTRCTYCAFSTYSGLSALIPPYMDALAHEIQLVGGGLKRPAHTVYFGGGTPSLIPAALLGHVLDRCRDMFVLPPGAEITLEANPGTVDDTYLRALRQIGVNRLSVGMQSANADELKLFGRCHRQDDVHSTVHTARRVGFTNINLDLIYGTPHQTLAAWQHSLDTALGLDPDHFSLYSLGIEENTPIQRQIALGTLAFPDPDLAADMYEWAASRLAAAGFEQYEISNWTRPGHASQHNLYYWRNLPYLGLGAGAHGYAARIRYANIAHPAAYIECIASQPVPLEFPCSAAADTINSVDRRQAMAETMLMGMRLTVEGVSLDAFRARFGHDLWSIYGAELDRLIASGLVEHTADARVRLTPRGRLLGNRVFIEFV